VEAPAAGGAQYELQPEQRIHLGKVYGTVGDFSNFGTAQANMQLSFRAEF